MDFRQSGLYRGCFDGPNAKPFRQSKKGVAIQSVGYPQHPFV
ncbi:hypothetical protein NUH87_06945 [Pseudomonas batumici]